MQSYHRTTHRDILEWCDKRVIMSDAMQGMMLVVRNWSRNDGNVWIIAILSLVLTTGDAGESGDTGWVGQTSAAWVGVTGSFLQVLVMIVGSDIVDPLSYVVRIQGGKNTRISEWNGWKASFVGMHSRELISEFLDIDKHFILILFGEGFAA